MYSQNKGMAYCRMNEDSDLWVVWTDDGVIECMGCRLKDIEPTEYYHFSELLQHIEVHRRFGHKIIPCLEKTLKKEQQIYGNSIANKTDTWLFCGWSEEQKTKFLNKLDEMYSENRGD